MWSPGLNGKPRLSRRASRPPDLGTQPEHCSRDEVRPAPSVTRQPRQGRQPTRVVRTEAAHRFQSDLRRSADRCVSTTAPGPRTRSARHRSPRMQAGGSPPPCITSASAAPCSDLSVAFSTEKGMGSKSTRRLSSIAVALGYSQGRLTLSRHGLHLSNHGLWSHDGSAGRIRPATVGHASSGRWPWCCETTGRCGRRRDVPQGAGQVCVEQGASRLLDAFPVDGQPLARLDSCLPLLARSTRHGPGGDCLPPLQ